MTLTNRAVSAFNRVILKAGNWFVRARMRWSGVEHRVRLASALDRAADRRGERDAVVARIEGERRHLLSEDRPLLPAGERAHFNDAAISIASACEASGPVSMCRVLLEVVREFKPQTVLELGTNLGISGAYIASALAQNGTGRLITVEGSCNRMRIARELHGRLGLSNVQYEVGLFDDVLPRVLAVLPPIDLAFIDGNHQYSATLAYYRLVRSRASPNSLIVFDDIRWRKDGPRPGMIEAWERIRIDPANTFSADLGRIGICLIKAAG